MAIIDVVNVNDDGNGSLRNALEIANSRNGLDTIRISQSLAGQKVVLTSGELQVRDDVVIEGIGAKDFTISGNNRSRVFLIDDEDDESQIHVQINDITIADGNLPTQVIFGAGIFNKESLELSRVIIRDNNGGSGGAGIQNEGNLVVEDSAILNNQVKFRGGVGQAAGINNFFFATAEIVNTLIRGNSSFRTGGGVSNSGNLSILNSTIAENIINSRPANSGFGGAGILNSFGTLFIDSSTIVDNEIQLSTEDRDDVNLRGVGIRVRRGTSATITNSIVARNRNTNAGEGLETNDVFGTFNSGGYNLIGDGTSSSGFTAIGDQAGTALTPLDPLLGDLRDNGGFSETYAPLLGSPTIDAANPFNAPNTEQRGLGFPRRIDGDGNGVRINDIGAVEFNPRFSFTTPGTPNNDRRFGNNLDNLIRGFAGNDTLDGRDGNDVIEGGDGNDSLRGRIGRDVLFGDRGNDRIVGGQNNDTLIGGPGADTIEGGGGRDRIIWNSGDGFDTVRGGNGLDTVEINGTAGGRDSFRVATGGSDLIVSSTGDSQLELSIEDVERLEFNGLGGNDRLSVANIAPTDVETIAFNGGKGNDFLLGSSSTVRLEASGGDGGDLLIGGNRNDRLDGGNGNDIVSGSRGNDFLSGGLGNDTVVGGDGNDFISDNAGNDRLTGGAGADRFAFFGNTSVVDGLEPFGRDIIRDFERGTDTLELLFFNGLNNFGGLDSNNNGVLDGSDRRISIVGSGTRIGLGDLFSQPIGTHQILLAGVTGLTSNDIVVL